MPGGRLTSEERAQIEVLYAQGLRFPQIASAIGRDRSTVWREVRRNHAHNGGAHAPGAVSHPGCRAGGVGSVARGLWRPYRWKYCHRFAQRRAGERALRPREGKLRARRGRTMAPLWHVVRERLAQRWSPAQVARSLRIDFPDRPEHWVSHETIYQAIYFQARGGLREELARQVALRSGRAVRKPQSRA